MFPEMSKMYAPWVVFGLLVMKASIEILSENPITLELGITG